MNTIKIQLQELSSIWKNIETYIKESDFLTEIINHLNATKQTIGNLNHSEITNTFGIYAFYIKPKIAYTFKELEKDWQQEGYQKYPQIVKSRFDLHIPIKTDVIYPLYIGKSEKLGSRIKEHITHENNVSTYGLKLKGRKFFTPENISFAYWELPPKLKSDKKEINKFIITQIERKLRNKLMPWIGKQ